MVTSGNLSPKTVGKKVELASGSLYLQNAMKLQTKLPERLSGSLQLGLRGTPNYFRSSVDPLNNFL
jgi:hypothetical protein